MKCPYCGELESKVIDSRPTEDGEKIRRRRECLRCGKRFTTYEIVETVPLMVIKKDRSRQVFDRQKLLGGMLRACEKRPVSYEMLGRAVDNIEQSLLNSYEREVTSIHIGELAMEELKKIDEVAYVRFASVYRQFSDLNTFMNELKEMLSKRSEQTEEYPAYSIQLRFQLAGLAEKILQVIRVRIGTQPAQCIFQFAEFVPADEKRQNSLLFLIGLRDAADLCLCSLV